MKRLLLLVVPFLFFAFNLTAGDIYQKGTIRLVPDNTFAQGLDWSKLFVANLPAPPIQHQITHEYMALAPDNTVYVVEYSNYTAGTVFKFTANGNLEATTVSLPGKVNPDMWARHLEMPAVNERNELWVSEYARLDRCDAQGKVLSVTRLDRSIADFLFLKGGEVVLMGGNNVGLFNFETAKETVVARFERKYPFFAVPLPPPPKPEMSKITGGKVPGVVVGGIAIGAPSTVGKVFIAGTPEGNLVTACSDFAEIRILSSEGHEIGKFTLPIERPRLSPEQKAKAVQRIQQTLDSLAAQNRLSAEDMERARERLKDYPTGLPYYSNLLTDDQGNILVFLTNPADSADAEFMAFSQSGKKMLGTCRFILPQGVTLRIDGRKQMEIRGGWLYALIRKNVSGKDQVQLARFKME